jgi:hypothetical protein
MDVAPFVAKSKTGRGRFRLRPAVWHLLGIGLIFLIGTDLLLFLFHGETVQIEKLRG